MWTSTLIGSIEPDSIKILRPGKSSSDEWISIQLKGSKSDIGFHDKEEFLKFVGKLNDLATKVMTDDARDEES